MIIHEDVWICLPQGRPVVAYDRLGFGQSDPRVEVMPDTRYVPHREREAAVLDLVADFLRYRVRREPPALPA